MKRSVKSGMLAAVVVAAGFAAYQSSGSYGAQDNSLLMQNVEALAQDNNGEPTGEPSGGLCSHKNPHHTPDHYLTVKVETAQGTSHKKGEITIESDGKTYHGDFEKDQTYTVVMEIKNCDGIQTGSCCDQRKVGVKVKKV